MGFLDIFRENELDRQLRMDSAAGKKSFLIVWNRGLGDIALGLYALVYRIREFIPDSRITFLTRRELADGFRLLEGVEFITVDWWERGVRIDFADTMARLSLAEADFDVVMERVNPTKWLSWQIGSVTPRLLWKEEYDKYYERFDIPGAKKFIGVHLNSETGSFYKYQKDWPLEKWEALFEQLLVRPDTGIILFGNNKTAAFSKSPFIDLRGETGLLELLSVIKQCCHTLIAPDGGILSLTYYIDAQFPLRVVSLWGDSQQGILKQNVSSPNKRLIHIPLIGSGGNISNIGVDEVLSDITSGSC